MTADNCATMSAGREIDALVAEKVMGWHRVDEEHSWWVDSNDEIQCYVDAFRPSNRHGMAAAWQVVTYLVERGISVSMYSACHGRPWVCVMGGNSAGAETMPLAICRAALAAVEPTALTSAEASR